MFIIIPAKLTIISMFEFNRVSLGIAFSIDLCYVTNLSFIIKVDLALFSLYKVLLINTFFFTRIVGLDMFILICCTYFETHLAVKF